MDEYILTIIQKSIFSPRRPVLPKRIFKLLPARPKKAQVNKLSNYFANILSPEIIGEIVRRLCKRDFTEFAPVFKKCTAHRNHSTNIKDIRQILLKHFFPLSIEMFLTDPNDYEICSEICEIWKRKEHICLTYRVATIDYLSYSTNPEIIAMARKLTNVFNDKFVFPVRTRYERKIFGVKNMFYTFNTQHCKYSRDLISTSKEDKKYTNNEGIKCVESRPSKSGVRYITFETHVINIMSGYYDPCVKYSIKPKKYPKK